jgi:DNA-binding transcriptional LysR family regulator
MGASLPHLIVAEVLTAHRAACKTLCRINQKVYNPRDVPGPPEDHVNHRAIVRHGPDADGQMTTIPTELLRTFVVVVERRSFTRAAQSLGITQPAVSAQVKRLQMLLGGDLMDKSAPGVLLTSLGEDVLGYARRMLALNDEMLNLAAVPSGAAQTIRLGVPGDWVGETLWRTLAHSRNARPDLRFHLKSSSSDSLIGDLRQGILDAAVAVSDAHPYEDARFHWTEDMVWVRAPMTRIDAAAPVPLVSPGERCLTHRQAADALERAGRPYDLAFTQASITGLSSAVAAGLGVMALPRCVARNVDLAIWDDAPLPALPRVVCSICVRAGADDLVGPFVRALAHAYAGGRVLALGG